MDGYDTGSYYSNVICRRQEWPITSDRGRRCRQEERKVKCRKDAKYANVRSCDAKDSLSHDSGHSGWWCQLLFQLDATLHDVFVSFVVMFFANLHFFANDFCAAKVIMLQNCNEKRSSSNKIFESGILAAFDWDRKWQWRRLTSRRIFTLVWSEPFSTTRVKITDVGQNMQNCLRARSLLKIEMERLQSQKSVFYNSENLSVFLHTLLTRSDLFSMDYN